MRDVSNLMRTYTLLLLVALIAACAHQYRHQDVEVLTEWPRCDFQRLGTVRISEGFAAVTNAVRLAPRDTDKIALAKLKQAAGDLGASKVVITFRERSGQQDDRGSVSSSPLVKVNLTGMAISNCAAVPTQG